MSWYNTPTAYGVGQILVQPAPSINFGGNVQPQDHDEADRQVHAQASVHACADEDLADRQDEKRQHRPERPGGR